MIVEEADKVAQLFKRITCDLSYYNALAIQGELDKYTEKELRNKIKEDYFSILVAVRDSTIVGYCITHFDCYTIWIDRIGILDEFRGQGIATLLLSKLEQTTKIRKCHKIWCDSRSNNTESIGLLKSLGYTIITTISNHWYGQDFVLLQKEI